MYFDLQYRCLFRIFISPYVWTKCKKDIVPDAHFKCSNPTQKNNKKIIIYFYPLGSSEFLVDFIGKLLDQAVVPILKNIFLRTQSCYISKILTRQRENESIFFSYSFIIQQHYIMLRFYGGDIRHSPRYCRHKKHLQDIHSLLQKW